MYELKKTGKVFTSKFVGTGPSSYKKRFYRTAVSQRLRNTGVGHLWKVPDFKLLLDVFRDPHFIASGFRNRLLNLYITVESSFILSSNKVAMRNVP